MTANGHQLNQLQSSHVLVTHGTLLAVHPNQACNKNGEWSAQMSASLHMVGIEIVCIIWSYLFAAQNEIA